ncbi:helix-turn-helix domain-containing protein [Candidatus Nitrospira bockiana]
MRVGRRIRLLRLHAGLTQEQLGERAGLHPTYLGGIERGERNVSLKTLAKVASALQVPLKNLVTFSDHDKEQTLDALKRLVLTGDSRMETFFAAFCGSCKYLHSFLELEGNHDAFAFFSISCKNCEPLRIVREFLGRSIPEKR